MKAYVKNLGDLDSRQKRAAYDQLVVLAEKGNLTSAQAEALSELYFRLFDPSHLATEQPAPAHG